MAASCRRHSPRDMRRTQPAVASRRSSRMSVRRVCWCGCGESRAAGRRPPSGEPLTPGTPPPRKRSPRSPAPGPTNRGWLAPRPPLCGSTDNPATSSPPAHAEANGPDTLRVRPGLERGQPARHDRIDPRLPCLRGCSWGAAGARVCSTCGALALPADLDDPCVEMTIRRLAALQARVVVDLCFSLFAADPRLVPIVGGLVPRQRWSGPQSRYRIAANR
jgi:hypothetical protein